MKSEGTGYDRDHDPALKASLEAIDRQTVYRVAMVPIVLAPLALALSRSGFVPVDPAQSTAQVVMAGALLAQALIAILFASRGAFRLAIGSAVLIGLGILVFHSLVVGVGLRTSSLYAFASLCLLTAYLHGRNDANAVAFLGLGVTIVIALALTVTPLPSGSAVAINQPTTMLASVLGLFINTLIICTAYNKKKYLLLNHLKSQTQALETALDQRKAALRERQDLLGQIAHNLRTPLATVRSALQLIERTAGQPERQQRYAGNLRTATEKMLWQTQQFALYAGLHEGSVGVHPERTRIRELVSQLERQFSTAITTRGDELRIDVAGSVPEYVATDAAHVHRMLRNLLDNALKYTEQGAITIRVDAMPLNEGESMLTFTVDDTGAGIHPDVQAEAYKPFVQGSENPANAMEGSGLGLYITQGLARRMGGDAGIMNRPGGGCSSWFALRVQSVPAEVRQAA